MGTDPDTQTWADAKLAWGFMLIPVIAYGIMFVLCKKFPIDERVENDISMSEMFQEFGGLGAFLSITFIGYELFSQLSLFSDGFADQFGGDRGKKYMVGKFKKLLLKISPLSCKEQHKALEDELAKWKGDKGQIDDICVMGVKV